MRGASTDSLASLTEELRASIDGGADGYQMADDLFGVSGVLREQPALRRTVTDLSLAPEAKSGFVRQLLAGRLADASLEVIASAVALRWAGTRDLGEALEQLGVLALVSAADRAGEGDALEGELFAFGRLVADNPELRDALSDPGRTRQEKAALIHGLLQGRVGRATTRLAEQAVTGTHRNVSLAVEEYQKVAASYRDRLVAVVRVARPLSAADQTRLEGALAQQYGRAVHLNVLVDPAVLGGMRVSIGGEVIDGTVASRLEDAHRRLAS